MDPGYFFRELVGAVRVGAVGAVGVIGAEVASVEAATKGTTLMASTFFVETFATGGTNQEFSPDSSM